MNKPHRQETITLLVNPAQLRRMANEMERRMKEVTAGQRVWSQGFYGDDLTIELLADQSWFQDRADGIPDWDDMAPGPDALARFRVIRDEKREFPNTYSGAGWHAAFRIWKAVAIHGPELLDTDGWSDIKDVNVDDLGLSGFQWGWALNAVRQMLGRKPGPNPAIVVVGAGDNQPVVPASGSPEDDMKGAIG